MKVFTQKNIIIWISAILVLCVGIFVVAKPTKAIQPISGIENGIVALQTSLGTSDDLNKKDLLTTFCKAAATNMNWFTDGSLYYSPNYSLFLGVLCKPFGVDIFLTVDGKQDYLSENFEKDWNSLITPITSIPANCSPTTNMKSCDLPKLLKTIFTAVMDDHSTLGIWYWAMSSNKVSDLVKDFSNTYFGDGETLCKWGDWFYLSNKSIAGAEACSHPQTYKYLSDVIQGLQKNIQAIRTINVKKLQDIQKDAGECAKWDNTFPNLFLCSYTSKELDNKIALQSNLWYNEVMYYNLLSKRLIMRYANDTVWLASLDLATTNDHGGTSLEEHAKEILALQDDLEKSKVALWIMQKSVANFQTSFPLHVWLVAYYEDVTTIRKSLVKVYTPLSQLYYTLRNVQTQQ